MPYCFGTGSWEILYMTAKIPIGRGLIFAAIRGRTEKTALSIS